MSTSRFGAGPSTRSSARTAPARPPASTCSPSSWSRRAGAITYNGRDITAMKPADVARLGLVRSFQISAVFPHLTVLENVRIALQRRARRQLRLLALREGADALDARCRRARRGGRPDRVRRHPGGRAVLRPQARAGDRHHARARSRDDAARRADGRHGPRGHRPHRGADPPGLGQPHHPDGRAQPVGRRAAVRTGSRCWRAARSWPRATTPPCRRTRASSRPTSGSAMPESAPRRTRPEAAAAPLLAVRDLNAWYGESHVLHGIELRRLPGRGGDAARPQRRRQDHDHEGDHGHARPGARARSCFDGVETIGLPARTIARHGIGYVPEERGIFASLSVAENLDAAAGACKPGGMTRDADLRAVPEPARARCRARAPSCRAASSRCWRSAASCAPARG